MPKIDLGEKQLCPTCGAKFYDLHKRPAQCPKCQNVFDPEDEAVKAKRAKARLTAFDPKLAAQAEEDDEDAPAVVADLDEDEVEAEEVTAELDAAAVDQAPLELDDDEDSDPVNQGTGGADVPEGFSEQDLDEDDPTSGDDEVPFLEDDEDLIDDDIGDLPAEDDESDPR